MCAVHYYRWRRGQIAADDNEVRTPTVGKAAKPFDYAVPSEFLPGPETADASTKPRGLVGLVRQMVVKYVHQPERAGRIMAHFYERAFRNDRVLLDFVKFLVPQEGGAPPVQVIINSPLMTQEKDITYDIEGNKIEVSQVQGGGDKS